DVQLGAAVLRTAFRIVGAVLVGVRRDRAALAVAVRADHARGVDAVAGQVVVHGARATLGQALVVGVGTDGVGVAGNLDAQVGVALQDLDGLVEDRDRVGTQGRLVEVEVHALQVDRDRHRAAVRTDGLASLRTGALVVAVVDAVAVVVHVGAARGDRLRRRGDRGDRLRAEGDGHAQRGQDVGEVVFLRTGSGLDVVEVDAGAQLGAQGHASEVELQADAEVGGEVRILVLVRIAAV